MKLSVKSDYAARAVLGLARRYPGGSPCRVEELAAEQDISAPYLVQILIELKAKQIVRSHRGKDGGYELARPPADITFGEVIRAVEGELFDAPALKDARCPAELQRVWLELARAVEQAADLYSFQRLLDEDAARDRMYYI